MTQDDLPVPARQPAPVDVPAAVAALAATFGGLIEAARESLAPLASQLAAFTAEAARRVEESPLLDAIADAADRGLVWAGSEDGRRLLAGVDTAMIGVRTAEFYGHTGVYRPLAPALVRDALERSAHHGPHDLRALLADVGPGSANWTWIKQGLFSSESVQDRLPNVRDALDCIEAGFWGPAVTTLLPVVEGVISDQARVLEGKRVGLRLEEVLAGRGTSKPDGIGDLITRPALRVIDGSCSLAATSMASSSPTPASTATPSCTAAPPASGLASTPSGR